MTQNVEKEEALPSVTPLRMRKPDGSLYCRPEEIEETLTVLLRLPTRELVERSRIEDAEAPNYVPSECMLYFVRRLSFSDDEDSLRDLFLILRQRILRAVPVLGRRLADSRKVGDKATELDVQEAVLDKFQELLCGDRVEYAERLDFFECRFNQALAFLRSTARRDARREESHSQPMDGDTNEFATEVELVLATLREPIDGQNGDFLYRSKLHVAISTLPLYERRVVELLLQDLPIDSKDKEVLTIVKILGCSEKTVRNRRDRAYRKLRDALKEEDDV
jgi:DNA-directed RNA polymerase specialized sigma24 family protein